LVDGREKFASPTICGGSRPLPVSVDTRGGTTLELVVDYAEQADVLDRADWLNARLVKENAGPNRAARGISPGQSRLPFHVSASDVY
jgi:hypothetical protein